MKKIIYLVLILIVTLCSCNKEKVVMQLNIKKETNRDSHNNDILSMLQYMTEDEYNNYVKNLIKETGVDVIQLSKSHTIDKIIDKPMQLFNSLSQINDAKSPLLLGGTLTEDKIESLQALYNNIQLSYNQGNENEVLILYQEFIQLCNTIDGFIISTGEFGIQTLYYNEEQVDFPTDYLQAEMNNAANCIDEVSDNYPNFKNLSDNQKIEVLAAAATNKISQNINDAKYYSTEDECKNEAARMYALSMGAATATYEAALIGCALSVVAAPSCVAIASASYGVAVAVASYQLHRAWKICEENNN